MRVLASLIAVCLVAAAGVRPVAAAPERPWATEVSRGAATVTTIATVATLQARGIDTAPPGRTDSSQLSRAVCAAASYAPRPSGPAGNRAPAPDLPAILVGEPVALAPRVLSAADPAARTSLLAPVRRFSTHAARGPPIV